MRYDDPQAIAMRTPARTQWTFNPADFAFGWTADWYTWDSKAAHAAAKAARDQKMRAAKAAGHTVKGFSLRDQLISRGGIGSGHPHIEHFVTVYGFNILNPTYSA